MKQSFPPLGLRVLEPIRPVQDNTVITTPLFPNVNKLLVTLTASLLCAGAFGQGKLAFDNSDGNHLIYFSPDTSKLTPADATKWVNDHPLAGSGAYAGPGSTIAALAGSPSFTAALYAGTSPNSLGLQRTTTIGDSSLEGSVVAVNCTFASLQPGTPAWFQIQVYDSRADSAWHAWLAGEYAGISQVFQATPQPSAYSPLTQATLPGNST